MLFNYSTVHLLLVIITLIVFLFIIRNNKQKVTELRILLIIALLLVCSVPTHSFNVSFSSLDKTYNYYYPYGRIVFKRNKKNTLFVYGVKKNFNGSNNDVATFFVRKNNKWECQKKTKELKKDTYCIYDEYVKYNVFIFYSKKDNITGIFVIPSSVETLKVSDNKNTSFEYFEGFDGSNLDRNKMISNTISFGILEGKIENDYYLIIDNRSYSIKEDIKSCFY